MYTHFQFFMQYDELCKVLSQIDNIDFCDLGLALWDKYTTYEQFSNIPDVDNEKEMWLLILDSREDFPFQSQNSINFNRIREYFLENKRWLTLERHRMLSHEDDVRLLGEYELTIHKDSRKNPECFKIYKDIKKEIQKNCVEKYTYFFGRDTFEQRADWIFAPFYGTDDYFKITEKGEYEAWYRNIYLREIMGRSSEEKLKLLFDLSRSMEPIIRYFLKKKTRSQLIEIFPVLSETAREYFISETYKIKDKRLHHAVNEVIRLSYIPNS